MRQDQAAVSVRAQQHSHDEVKRKKRAYRRSGEKAGLLVHRVVSHFNVVIVVRFIVAREAVKSPHVFRVVAVILHRFAVAHGVARVDIWPRG